MSESPITRITKAWPILVFAAGCVAFFVRTEMITDVHSDEIKEIKEEVRKVDEIPRMKEDTKEIKSYLKEMTKGQIDLIKAIERIEAKME